MYHAKLVFIAIKEIDADHVVKYKSQFVNLSEKVFQSTSCRDLLNEIISWKRIIGI